MFSQSLEKWDKKGSRCEVSIDGLERSISGNCTLANLSGQYPVCRAGIRLNRERRRVTPPLASSFIVRECLPFQGVHSTTVEYLISSMYLFD